MIVGADVYREYRARARRLLKSQRSHSSASLARKVGQLRQLERELPRIVHVLARGYLTRAVIVPLIDTLEAEGALQVVKRTEVIYP